MNDIRLHCVTAGSGPPVVLLHGWPETWFAWRKQIPVLAEHYSLIVPDLRGYGDSDKPASGYDKRQMADDVSKLCRQLGHDRVAVVGHDRGARVAARWAKDEPDVVDRLVVMDNIPTRVVFEAMNGRIEGLCRVSPGTLARGYWFFLFNQEIDLPEALITGREEVWLRHWLGSWCYNRDLFEDWEVAEYVRAYSAPGALRGSFNDYRAGPIDVAQDLEDANTKIAAPVMAMWGEDFDLVGQWWDVAAVWATMADDLRTVALPRCGHLCQEERADLVNPELLSFLDGWNG
ncbi:MAG: alpha/beta hydrolase [Acidimicrobiaceae bacterium]|nr:alpha/beta hydrolase [Acidimicrobiaceae bacterium]